MTEKKKKWLVIAVLTAMFLFGCCFVKDAGVYFDEKSEQEILYMNVLQYSDVFHINKISGALRDRGIIPICESVERDHGIATHYLSTPILMLLDSRADLQSTAWHMYTYVLFFLGVVYMYRLLGEVFQSKRTALAGAMILFFSPRIFGDGLYNNKDCVLLAMVIVMLFYGVRFIEKRNFGSAVLLGISAAFAGNLKISGIYVLALIGIYYLICLTVKKEWNRHSFLAGLTAAGTAFLGYLALTPAIWGQGFHLIRFIQWNLSNATNFSRTDGAVLFEGQMYRYSENPLPWYYLPKIITLTIPVPVSVMIVAGVLLWVKFGRRWNKAGELYPLFALIPAIPVIAAMVGKPNIYNGWRHFYFIYGAMIVLASYTVHYMIHVAKYKKVTTAVLSLCIAVQVAGVSENGIASTTYMNSLAGGDAGGRYELDYYGVTAKRILKSLVDSYGNICVKPDSKGAVIVNREALPSEYRDKITLVYTDEDIEQAKKDGETVLGFINTSYDETDGITNGNECRGFKAWDNTYVKIRVY